MKQTPPPLPARTPSSTGGVIRYGCLAVVVIVILGGIIAAIVSQPGEQPPTASQSKSEGQTDSTPSARAASTTSTSNPTRPAQTGSATPSRFLALAELTPSDRPPSVTLRKPVKFRFKKGSVVTLQKNAPLFFGADYLRDGKPGTQLEVLDYSPEKLRVYCRSQDASGKTIAVNILESHVDAPEAVSVPAGAVVAVDHLAGSTVWVTYDGARQVVPITDTDFLEQATKQRARNEAEARRQAQQVERDRMAREEAARQAIAQQRRQAEAAEQAKIDSLGPKPVASLWDGSYSEVATYLKRVLNDPESMKIFASTKPFRTDDAWVVGCDYGAKNAFGGMVRKHEWFVEPIPKPLSLTAWYM